MHVVKTTIGCKKCLCACRAMILYHLTSQQHQQYVQRYKIQSVSCNIKQPRNTFPLNSSVAANWAPLASAKKIEQKKNQWWPAFSCMLQEPHQQHYMIEQDNQVSRVYGQISRYRFIQVRVKFCPKQKKTLYNFRYCNIDNSLCIVIARGHVTNTKRMR